MEKVLGGIMNITLVTSFYKDPGFSSQRHQSLSKVFFDSLGKWRRSVDRIIISDNSWGVEQPIVYGKQVLEDVDVFVHPGMSHWQSLSEVTSYTKSADVMMYLDQDMLIYEPDVVRKMRETMEQGADYVGILDGSGKHQFFPQNEFRASRARFCPYLCMIKRDLVMEADNFFDPSDGYDTMGKLTERMIQKYPKLNVSELPDDRTSVYWRNGVVRDSFLDGKGFIWSEPLDAPVRRGYYHLRNANLGLDLQEQFLTHKTAYNKRKEITPQWEALRSLAWWYFLHKTAINKTGMELVDQIVQDFGITQEDWKTYTNSFYEFHPWIKEL